MGEQQEKFRGTVERITFHNPDNGYTVAKVSVPGQQGLLTMVGTMVGVAEGQGVEVTGRSRLHPKFGPQVEVESCRLTEPDDAHGVERYLASGLIKGVGPVLAQRLVRTLGENAVEVILNEPRKLRQVPGVGRKKAQAIAKAVAEHGMLREAMIFLQGHGVGTATALRIYKHYGADTRRILETSPHRLAADIRGIGFATADRIAAQVGVGPEAPSRLEAGLIHTLHQAAEEGHCYLPYDELMSHAADLLQVDRRLLGPCFARLHQDGAIAAQDADGASRVYLGGMLHLEQTAAQGAASLIRGRGILEESRAAKAAQWVAGQMAIDLSPGQLRALEVLASAPLAVLTGGPGTGKTTMVRALLAIAEKMSLTVQLAAPTGRAAKRLSEAGGLPAQTLHRLLEFAPKDNAFLRGPENPLDCDLLIVDEASMIDIWLAAHLLEAVSGRTRLILVGDVNQLPPVGPGLPFRQIIDSARVPVARLTEIFRQKDGGLIVENAHRILAGQMPRLPEPGQEADFYFLEEPDAQRSADLVADLVARRLPDKFGLDPMEDIQVLAPMHRGNLGCRRLNELLRDRLNPGAQGPDPGPGDKVMQVRNNYDLEVFNGDMGRVLASGDELAVEIDGRRVLYGPTDKLDLSLAYAVTIHKSQGSEYPAVIVALAGEHHVMLNRPLIYTAVTRGRGLVVVAGSRQALQRAVSHDQPVRRYAALDRRLDEMAAVRAVTLIGMPGVGKSHWGRRLAELLGWRFVDGDDLLEQRFGGGVQQILDSGGRDAYVDLEGRVVMELDLSRPTVFSPGGSVIYSQRAMRWLRARSTVVFLEDDLERISGRINNLDHRGVVGLTREGGLKGLWEQRRPLYRRYCHHTINLAEAPDAARAIAAILGDK